MREGRGWVEGAARAPSCTAAIKSSLKTRACTVGHKAGVLPPDSPTLQCRYDQHNAVRGEDVMQLPEPDALHLNRRERSRGLQTTR